MHNQFKEIDPKELELPDTVFIRDIESRVFQAIVIKCLADIEGVALLEGKIEPSTNKANCFFAPNRYRIWIFRHSSGYQWSQ